MRIGKEYLLVAAVCLAGCGGGGGSSDGEGGGGGGVAPPEPSRDRIDFGSSTATRTVLPQGTLSFLMNQQVAIDQTLRCVVVGLANACLAEPKETIKGAQVGVATFSGLPVGRHTIRVQITDASGRVVAEEDHEVNMERPAVVVYGATPAGISAALAASRAGQTVALLEPSKRVGGMITGGLAKTDMGARGAEVLGGIAADFFDRVRRIESAANKCADGCNGVYDLEPRVARDVFEQMLSDSNVIVERSALLQEVSRTGSAIQQLTTSRGAVSAQMFIDASYEGDLMAYAGVAYAVGREARQIANPPDDAEQLALQEDFAGVRRYRVPRNVLYADPYVVAGDSTSGVLPFLEPMPTAFPAEGESDSRVMAYTYRLCVTNDPVNRIPFEAPEGYDPKNFEAIARILEARQNAGLSVAEVFDPAPTVLSRAGAPYMKYDLNGGSTFSIDMTGPDLNQRYVEAGEPERQQVRQAYRQYIQGLLYFWQTDPRFPALNQRIARFGLCQDEFADQGNWPNQLYVRQSRRMIGAYVMRESDVLQNGRLAPITDAVGFGSYDIDMHAHRYLAAPVNWPDGTRREAITVEGFLIVRLPEDRPYPISYRALVPAVGDATNLLNPVTLSASHVAYSSLRMEPTFMILGESAGVAAALAIELNVSVQEVPYASLRTRLLAQGQYLGQ